MNYGRSLKRPELRSGIYNMEISLGMLIRPVDPLYADYLDLYFEEETCPVLKEDAKPEHQRFFDLLDMHDMPSVVQKTPEGVWMLVYSLLASYDFEDDCLRLASPFLYAGDADIFCSVYFDEGASLFKVKDKAGSACMSPHSVPRSMLKGKDLREDLEKIAKRVF